MATTEEEIRYWPRIGMYVNRKFADEWIERLGITGRVLDDDIEEFVDVDSPTAEELEGEINELFENPFEEAELSTENEAIMELIQFESDKKAFILSKKDEGMTLDEAKKAYEETKGDLVREHLDLPETPEGVTHASHLDEGDEEE